MRLRDVNAESSPCGSSPGGWRRVVGVSLVVFFVIRLSGDPTYLLLPPTATEEDRVRLARQLGLDRPIWVQYGIFAQRALGGDFGRSLRFGEPAIPLVLERLPATLELTVAALVVSLLISIPAGILSALRLNKASDSMIMLGALFGQSMPVFWLRTMLILLFAVRLEMFPTSGRGSLMHLAPPAVTLGPSSTPRVTRLARPGLLDVMGQDYIRTAWAKGLPRRRVIVKHALRNTLIPVVTIVGLELGTLGGAVITETIFAWPDRAAGRHRHLPARLPRGAGSRDGHRAGLRRVQSAGGPRLRVAGSAHTVRLDGSPDSHHAAQPRRAHRPADRPVEHRGGDPGAGAGTARPAGPGHHAPAPAPAWLAGKRRVPPRPTSSAGTS